MVNGNSISIPNGIDLSKLNIAFELMWLNKLFKDGYISEEEYFNVKRKIKQKYL